MNVREKLIELLSNLDIVEDIGGATDYLISEGVTVAEQCDGNCFVCPRLCERRKATYCG